MKLAIVFGLVIVAAMFRPGFRAQVFGAFDSALSQAQDGTADGVRATVGLR